MRVPKTGHALIVDLRDQLDILAEYLQQARSGDERAIKIVAPILRDLVCKYRSNSSPLLFRIANKNNITPQAILDVPPNFPSKMPLKDYLEETGFASGTENIQLSNRQLIKSVADQLSIVHTDNGVDRETFAAMGWGEIRIGAYQPHIYALINIGEVVLAAGTRLIEELTNIAPTSPKD